MTSCSCEQTAGPSTAWLAKYANPTIRPTNELRRKGRTYREVARLFHERLGLHVAPIMLHSFVKVRAKHCKHTQFELTPIEPAVVDSPVLDRVVALKKTPHGAGREGKRSRFVFRENEPLTLTTNGGEQ